MPNRTKRPRDTNQLAKRVVDIATGDVDDSATPSNKNPHAVELGRLGGRKGGPARRKALSEDRRREIAKKAAKTRWSRKEH